ncbi:type II secretion system protein [Idiomarina sp. HP20-50]|uniref:PilW family protein n=1 Tax=Idiomarina sp. HP20-50 TaxID=3070813 RepID=UPI00294B8904|nr:type II secretion system protein [Idiomarina sp. HP20-50]MDV6315949.1 type II secretion system protein [Idiomarina sp. HP20-50]
MNIQRGFTLIELIIVIVLLAIVASFSFQFVGIGAQMFSTGSERLQTIEKSRFAIERLTREIRGAVPNSARVRGKCLEFVPADVVGTYYDAPIRPSSSDEMTFVTFAGSGNAADISWSLDGNERIYIYATRANFIYSDNPQRYANFAGGYSSTSLENTLPLEPGSQFAKESPLNRAYIGSEPVSFCVSGENLYRVSGYGWQQSQTEWSNGDLIATGVNNDLAAFDVDANNQQSNNIITLQLQFGENAEEPVFYYREVHIPNAP